MWKHQGHPPGGTQEGTHGWVGVWIHVVSSGGHDHGGKAQTGSLSSKVHVKASWSGDGKSLGVDIGGHHHSGEGFADV